MATKHEIKQCPACGSRFECKLNNPMHCQCAQVTLSIEQLEHLQTVYDDCLCAGCLRRIAGVGPGRRPEAGDC
jgi:hypothetical protein